MRNQSVAFLLFLLSAIGNGAIIGFTSIDGPVSIIVKKFDYSLFMTNFANGM